ncbi:hypothetical protein D3C71_1389500 [compost metagenome]
MLAGGLLAEQRTQQIQRVRPAGFGQRIRGAVQGQLPVGTGCDQQADGIRERHVVDPGRVSLGRLLFGDHQQYRASAFSQQRGSFKHAVFQAIACGGQGGHFAGFTPHDRPQANDRVMHRQAEPGRRQRLVGGQITENIDGAGRFAVTGNKDQWQILPTFGQRPADTECHARQTAEPSTLHGRQKGNVGSGIAVRQHDRLSAPGLPIGHAIKPRGPGAPLGDVEVDHRHSSHPHGLT